MQLNRVGVYQNREWPRRLGAGCQRGNQRPSEDNGRMADVISEYDVPGHELPDWVRKPKQVTDGHLLQLAAKHGGVLVTLDSGIPGATLIPEVQHNHPSVREPYRPYGVAA